MASEQAPCMLTPTEYSLLLVAVAEKQVTYLESRNFRAARTLTKALRKVENELVPVALTEGQQVELVEDAEGQLTMRWPHEQSPLW